VRLGGGTGVSPIVLHHFSILITIETLVIPLKVFSLSKLGTDQIIFNNSIPVCKKKTSITETKWSKPV
jgi:hypothetical protein